MAELLKELEKAAEYLYDAGRSDLALHVLTAMQKLFAAEEMALAVVAAHDADNELWSAMKAYRKAGESR